MKILLISNMYPSKNDIFYGIFVKNFTLELSKNGMNVEKVVIYGKGKTKIEKLKKYFLFYFNIAKKISSNDFDLIYVHYMGLNLLPFLFFKSNKPLFINAHGSDVLVNSKFGLFIQKVVTSIIRRADKIIVPSDYFSDVVCKKFTLSKDKIFVSPSGGIDTNIFKPLEKEMKSDIFTIGYVSRIDKGKGWDILLEAVYKLKKNNLKFQLVLIGGGLQENLFSQKLVELDLKDYINYLGVKKHEELAKYFNFMDVFIFPTKLNESLGLVGLEAMACGVPVVGSNIGGLPSYITDGVNGKLFEPGNSEELAKYIEFFMTMDREEIERYQTQALETAKRYDSRLVNQKLNNLMNGCKNEKTIIY